MNVISGPTPRQRDFVLKLAAERAWPTAGATAEERVRNVEERLERGASGREVSSWIDWLLRQPRDAQPAKGDLKPGVYRLGEEVYVVKPNRDKTRLYAKRMVVIGGERLTEAGTVENIEFEYAPGAIHRIRPEHRMPLAEAEELTIRYGRCIVCGRRLKAARSVKEGIGPVCRELF